MSAHRQLLKGRLERLKYDLQKSLKDTEDLLRIYPWRSLSDGVVQTKYEAMLRTLRSSIDKKLGPGERESPFAQPGTPRRGPVDSTSAETAYTIYKDLQAKCETQERESKEAHHQITQLRRENAELQRQLGKTMDEVKLSTQTPRIHPDVVVELRKQVNILRGEKADLRKQLKQVYTEKNEHMNRVVVAKNNRLGDGNNPQEDPNKPTTIAERLTAVYNTEWVEAYEELTKTYDSERECTDRLLSWLTTCYEICRKKAEEQRDRCKRSISLDEKPQPTAVPSVAAVAIRDFQKKTALTILPTVRELCWNRLGIRSEEPELLAPYVHKCADLCWYMAIQNPPLEFEWLMERGTTFDPKLFNPYTITGDNLDYVVWPVLYMGAGLTVLAKGVAQGCDK